MITKFKIFENNIRFVKKLGDDNIYIIIYKDLYNDYMAIDTSTFDNNLITIRKEDIHNYETITQEELEELKIKLNMRKFNL